MWDLVAAGLEAKAAAAAGEVLVMRLDVLLDILAARARLLNRARGTGRAAGDAAVDGAVTRGADGTRTVAITSMSSLASFLASGGRPL